MLFTIAEREEKRRRNAVTYSRIINTWITPKLHCWAEVAA